MNTHTELVPIETITGKIHLIRGVKVMLDEDLAYLYGVTTKRFNEQIRRNRERFPPDFMFRLTSEEFNNLRSQFATSSTASGHGGRRHLPLVFTEHGAIMAATVLNSRRAVEISIYVVRAFVKHREMRASNKKFAKRLDELESRLTGHDENFRVVFETIKQLIATEETSKRKIGF